MQILIMRHGDAAIAAASDAQRALTANGSEESKQIASWLQQQNSKVERVLVSPYLRAKQTLAAVKTCLPLPAGAEEMSALIPGGDAAQVADYLQTLAKKDVASVMVISHLPLVGYLISELCPQEPPPMFATSAIAQVSLDKLSGVGQLDWQVSPAQLKVTG